MKETEDHSNHHVEDERSEDNGIVYALPGHLDYSCGEYLNVDEENNLCFRLGMISDGKKDESRYTEDLSSFLALLGSIPLQRNGYNFETFDHVKPDPRYMLRKRFGRGAYGEVWLAFQWNCSQGAEDSDKNNKNRNFSKFRLDLESCDENSGNFSSGDDCQNGSNENQLFILKRIMVERGSAVYLSGLREKHFGEVFLNASKSFGELLIARVSSSLLNDFGAHVYTSYHRDKVIIQDSGEISGDTFTRGNRTWILVYEKGLDHIARYVESFESRSNEIWLVFRHEGISLSKLLYTREDSDDISFESVGHAQVVRPSKWWHWLKTTSAGQEEMRSIVWQLLMALKSCHDRNITHRDIKPENMVICIEDQETGGCIKQSPTGELKHVGRMRIIDFGSAIDDFTMKRFYGFKGPSRAEQTYEYTPPEALLNTSWFQGPTSRTLKYDMWSVGVVFLEFILGSPDVFQISSLSHALLDKLLEGWNEDLKGLAYRLRSFMEMCILVPGLPTRCHANSGSHDKVKDSLASWKCSEEFFSNLIKSRDPLNMGFPNVWAMRLVRQLLRWDPVRMID